MSHRRPGGASSVARLLVLLAATFGLLVPVASAGPELRHAAVTPIAASSPCVAEPKDPIYGNAAYDPTKKTDFFNGVNRPSLDDLTPNRQAGAHTDLCLGYQLTPDFDPNETRIGTPDGVTGPDDPSTHFDTGDDQRNVIVDLPVGALGSLRDAGVCTNEQFGKDGMDWPWATDLTALPTSANDLATCPASSRVGEAGVRASTGLFGLHVVIQDAFGPGAVPFTEPAGQIFNLEHGPNELGRLGVQIMAPIAQDFPAKFVVRLVLAPDGSGRVRAIVQDAPRQIWSDAVGGPVDLYIEGIMMRMWGAKSAHPTMNADFMENGTSCATGTGLAVDLTTYGGSTAADPATFAPVRSTVSSAPLTYTGCGQVPFLPSVAVSTTERRPGVPTGVQVDVSLGQSTSGPATALLKDAEVTMPQGLELGAQVGSDEAGLRLCSAAQFDAAHPLTPNGCDAATKAGRVDITSPLVAAPLTGSVYLGEPSTPGGLPDLYLEAAFAGATAADAPRVKLVGTVQTDADGRLTATFRNNPQLRFSLLRLTFDGGPHALFTTPSTCGEHTSTSRMTPWSGQPPVDVIAKVAITDDCEVPFAPTVTVSPADPIAGGRSATRIAIERPDRAAWLTSATVSLPAGFLADLGRAAECAPSDAAAAACSEASRIATVTTVAGAGDQPLELRGAMYLTERRDGDVAGASIVVRAKIGDLDLGDVVVPGRIALRPTDAGLDFRTDIPTRHRGVALQLRKVIVDLDRKEFPVNPSACGPLGYSAVIAGAGGATASPSGSVSYSGCGDLPFRPSLKATLTGDNRPGGFPGMYVRLDSPEGDVGMRSASVTLPQGVAAALPNVRNPCPREEFDAVRCPAASRVGSVVARVSITPDAIRGDIFLIRVPGKTLPGLGLSFTGRYAQRVTSIVEVNKDGRLVTSFPAIPDLPLRSLEIQVDSGPRSPLQLPEGACAGGSNWDGVFTGQGGQTASAKTGLQCAASANARLSDKRGLTVRLFDFGGRKLSSVKATLPAGWRFDRAAAKKKGALWVRMTGATPSVRLTARSLTAFSRSQSATDVRVKIGGRVVRPTTRSARKAKSVSIPLRLAFIDGTVQTQTLTVATR